MDTQFGSLTSLTVIVIDYLLNVVYVHPLYIPFRV